MKLILVVISIVILACGDNESPVNNHVVAPEPKPIINLSAPVIKKIVVPDQVHAGARIKLDAVAEDPDGNALTYNWQMPGKLIHATTSGVATWAVPIDMGVVTVTLTVNDGIYKTTKSTDVRVIHSLIVPGKEAAGIRLIDRLNHVIDLYGEPSNQVEAKDLDVPWDLGWDTGFEWKNVGLIVYFRSNRIYQIRIRAPNTAKTAGGNGIGSNCDEARREFGRSGGSGKPRVEILDGDEEYYPYGWDHKGIQIRCYMSIIKWIVIYKKEKLSPGVIAIPGFEPP